MTTMMMTYFYFTSGQGYAIQAIDTFSLFTSLRHEILGPCSILVGWQVRLTVDERIAVLTMINHRLSSTQATLAREKLARPTVKHGGPSKYGSVCQECLCCHAYAHCKSTKHLTIA
jgi:hypothetical protein